MPDLLNTRRLDTWNEIATFLGVTVRTAMRWERDRGLPVHRVPGGEKQRVFAYPAELTVWLDGVEEQENAGTQVEQAVTGSRESPASLAEEPFVEAPAVALPSSPPPAPRRRGFLLTLLAVALMLALLGSWGYSRYRDAGSLEVNGVRALTTDGLNKEDLVTDGRNLYYGVVKEGRTQLASVPVTGGAPRILSELAPNVLPVDISADGRELLVLRFDGKEHERELWIVSTADGAVRRVGTILCHSAAWRGQHTLVFAAGKEIYQAAATGDSVRRIAVLDGIALQLHWSADGTRLRYLLRDPISGQLSAWEAQADKQGQLSQARMVSRPGLAVWQLSNADRSGRYFLLAGSEFTHRDFWLAAGSNLRGPIQPSVAGTVDTMEIAYDPQGRGLYALMNRGSTSEMYRFENNHAFYPYLPGLSVSFLDFSPDGKRIAYVTTGWSTTLWSSNVDGSNAVELDPDLHDVELPRWSPDGSRIACMIKKNGRPWRIYIVPSGGGRAEEAVAGNDGQGAPTWSPDGRQIAYGGIECEEMGTCAIHVIDLASGRVDTLPGSSGLGTARWSPDGNYIAALHSKRHALYLYDRKSRQWTMLADYVNGNDLSWSRDSRYLYAIRDKGTNPAILRVPLHGHLVPETMIDLAPLNELPGYMDTFFCLAPDGAIIALRYRSAMDLYSLDLRRSNHWLP